jgi:hypothetical protein
MCLYVIRSSITSSATTSCCLAADSPPELFLASSTAVKKKDRLAIIPRFVRTIDFEDPGLLLGPSVTFYAVSSASHDLFNAMQAPLAIVHGTWEEDSG